MACSCAELDAACMQVYQEACKPVVESALDGFNGTVFAYGVTSSGKMHTITVSALTLCSPEPCT